MRNEQPRSPEQFTKFFFRKGKLSSAHTIRQRPVPPWNDNFFFLGLESINTD